jgi:hypothetical protein
MNPEDISENFGESHSCKNLKFEKKWWILAENGEYRTHLGKIHGSQVCDICSIWNSVVANGTSQCFLSSLLKKEQYKKLQIKI